jgi:Tfp pilus assembly protein PilO
VDIARSQKIANAVEARLPIHVKPVIGGEIERMKCFVSLIRSLPKIIIEHLLPARGMQAGRVSDHAVKVEQNRVVMLASDGMFAL